MGCRCCWISISDGKMAWRCWRKFKAVFANPRRHDHRPGQRQIRRRGMRLGAVDFLEKPFQREQFMTVLARLQRLTR